MHLKIKNSFLSLGQFGSLILSKKLQILFGAIVALYLHRFITSYSYRLELSYTDTAGFLELIGHNSPFKPLQGDYFRSARGLVPLLNTGPDKICSVLPFKNFGDPSFFGIHPYLISLPLSAISWLVPVRTIYFAAAILTASIVIGIVALVLFMRKLKVSLATILLVVVSIGFYPVLVQSLDGQAYFDRLMFGPGIVLFLLVWWTKYKSIDVWKWICFLSILLAMISERGAALAALIAVGYTTLLHGKQIFKKPELRWVLLTGVCVFVYFYIWATLWQSYSAYGNLSFALARNRFTALLDDPLYPMTKVFVFTSLAFLCAAVFSGRGFLVLIVSLLSNLLVSVGGAELTGFATHYHQTYLPVIIAAAIIGITRLDTFLQQVKPTGIGKTGIVVLGASLLYAVTTTAKFNVYENDSQRLFGQTRNIWWTSPEVMGAYSDQSESFREIGIFVKGLPGGTVSVPEGLMPTLFQSGIKDVEYYPVGVGVAEIVVAAVDENGPNPYPFGFWGDTETLRSCLQNVLSEKYTLIKSFRNSTVQIYVLNKD